MSESADYLQGLKYPFDFMLRFANDIILLMDESGKLLEANDVAAQAYGWTLDELLALNIRDLRDPATLDKVQEQLRLTAKTGALFETRHRRRDGSVFPVEVSSRLFEHNGKKYRQSIVRDITQRCRMQSRLERDARRFEGLLRLNEEAGRLPEKAFMQSALNWVESLTGSRIACLFFVDEDQQKIELAAWSAAGEKCCRAGGSARCSIGEAGIWGDCLRERRALICNDCASHPGQQCAPAESSPLQRMVGVPVIDGGGVRVIIGVGDKEADYDEDDVEIVRLFGNDIWRIISRQRLEGELIANLEQQRALNKKLEEAQGHLLQSEKMASLGQLAAGVAHELNNPIGFVYSNMGSLEGYVNDIFAINSALELACKAPSAGALEQVKKLKQERDYDYIRQDIFQLMAQSRDGLARMRKIVQDLKDFSHVGEEGWKWVDLHRGIESTLNIVWNELKYKCRVVKEYGRLPEVYCMPSQINQVLMNMLVNAGQAIEDKGVVTIRTGADQDRVWIEIEDTGRGIPADQIKRIFEPFFTTKPVGIGTGLGLSLSFGIVQKHRGHIDVRSELGKGTAMRVWLPIKPDGPA